MLTLSFVWSGLNTIVLTDNFNEEFCLNGIDTTHKFVKVNFYDSLSQIDNPIFKVLISQYGDQLKPIEVIVGNFNYVAPNNA